MSNHSIFYFAPIRQLSQRLDRWVEGRLWLKVLIGLALGTVLGLLLGPELGIFSDRTVAIITSWLALPGQIFLALIQMIVVPLVIASVVRGLASNRNFSELKRIGLFALFFILVTTVVGTTIGIGMGQLIKPGNFVDGALLAEEFTQVPATAATGFPAFEQVPDKLVGLFPNNPMASMVSGEMLQVILFAAILGFALISIEEKRAQPLMDLLGALQEVSMRVVSWAMYLAPFAVFGLITRLVANLGIEVLGGMLMYVITVIAGLLLMALVYLLVVGLVCHTPVLAFLRRARELLLLAFSTSSSAAVMPITMQLAENEYRVNPGISRFLIPLGATINMTGTALYQGVATVFLAQIFQVDLSLTSYVFVVTMAIAASVGSPATPGAGIVILSMVLEGVGIPAAGVALLLGVDRVLDMCRTAINVMGDLVMCLAAGRWVGEVSHTLDDVEEGAEVEVDS